MATAQHILHIVRTMGALDWTIAVAVTTGLFSTFRIFVPAAPHHNWR